MTSMSDTKMSHADAVARITNPELKNPPLLLPNVQTFGELFEYVSEWDHKTMSHYDGVISRPDLRPAPRIIDTTGSDPIVPRHRRDANELGPYCTVNANGRKHRGIAVVATDAVVDAIAPRIVTPDDCLSFRIIEHEASGWALVIAQHGYIIGSHWLAYIDPATIPTAE